MRIIGEVTPERLDTLRRADHVVAEEVRRAGLYRELWQSFAVLPAVRTVGVMGDGRTYEYPVVVRAVTSEDAMTADWARLPYDLLERIVVADHQRGARGEPGRLRHHQQATRHHRVGVTMDRSALESTARALVVPGKGILAADESGGTIKKRFDKINVESTETNRRAYRDLLFTADGIGDYISGVILFDETIRQACLDGDISFPKVLESQGDHPRDQGRHRREASRPRRGRRDRHRGPRRAARPPRRVPRPRCPVREVAGHVHDHRRAALASTRST